MASLEWPISYEQTEWKLLSHRFAPDAGSVSWSSSSDLVGILDFYMIRKHCVVADILGLDNTVQAREFDIGPHHSHQQLILPLGQLVRNRIVNNCLLDRLAELGVAPVSSVEIAISLLGLVCDAIDVKARELCVAVEVEIKTVHEVHHGDAEQRLSSFEAADHDDEANDTREGMTCVVCLEDLYSGDIVQGNYKRLRKLPCNHLFHNSCLVPWLERSRTCPLCRRELVEDC